MRRRLPNRAEEIKYRLLNNNKFKSDVLEIRRKFGLPDNGVSNKENYRKWHSNLRPGQYGKFLDAYGKLQAKWQLPHNFFGWIEDYLIHSDKLNTSLVHNEHRSFCDITFNYDNKLPVVNIQIFSGASVDLVKEEIEYQWRQVSKHLKSKRIRTIKYKDRNRLVLELMGKDRKELGLKKGDYKDIAVAKILREQYNIKISEENIRKINSREKRMAGSV